MQPIAKTRNLWYDKNIIVGENVSTAIKKRI